MNRNSLSNRLSQLMDEHRNSTSLEMGLNSISLLLLLTSRTPDLIKQINEMGTAFQLPAIQSLCDDLVTELPGDIGSLPEHLDPEFLIDALQLVTETEDPIVLAEALREYHEKSKAVSAYVANSNEVVLMTALTGNTADKVVFDGAAGLARIPSNLKSSRLVLQELDELSWKISYRLLLMTGQKFSFEHGNSLSNPQVLSASCDLAIMTPPFGLRLGTAELQAIQKEGSYLVVKPNTAAIPSSANDSLWIQLALYSLKDTGRACLILPPGWLFRGGYDGKVREYLLENELIEAVIGLPKHFLNHTAIEPMVLVLARNREKGSPIHFVDASQIGVSSLRQHQITTEDAQLIAELASGRLPEDHRYKAVYMSEIRRHDNVLSIQQYIKRQEEINVPDLADAIRHLAEAEEAHHQAQNHLNRLMRQVSEANSGQSTH